MAEDQKENVAANGNSSPLDHDEYEYLKLIKKIIETGKNLVICWAIMVWKLQKVF